ncbi:PREDICTED: uncharacterized protein LOC105981825 [Dipodomys ordii]|uniref:Uncharacterized protein LOC105981825 n=1 Tax=Dipodomys ordii TaxID=10020 RepID=A0A1S3ET74_DIPOR|nr:PREDICTED: uncharacterized protein LOC105981825 [Dipodomys ordii]
MALPSPVDSDFWGTGTPSVRRPCGEQAICGRASVNSYGPRQLSCELRKAPPLRHSEIIAEKPSTEMSLLMTQKPVPSRSAPGLRPRRQPPRQHHSEASQDPFLEKSIHLSPTCPEAGKGVSSAENAQRQEPSLLGLSLQLQPHPRPRHAADPEEPVSVSRSTLGQSQSSKSQVPSTEHSTPKECSNTSLLSSGYSGDEESSQVGLKSRGRSRVPLSKRLRAQLGSTQSSQVCVVNSPRSRRHQLNGQGLGLKQVSSGLFSSANSQSPSKTNSSQSIQTQDKGPTMPNSNISLLPDKKGDKMTSSSQVTQGEAPAQRPPINMQAERSGAICIEKPPASHGQPISVECQC